MSHKTAPPSDAEVNKLLSKVGGTLEQAVNSQELKWSSKYLDAGDARVVAYVVTVSTVLQKLVLGANSIGDAGASSIAEVCWTLRLPDLHPIALIIALHLTALRFQLCTSRRSRSTGCCTRLF